jgi:DNA replication protein DnaC
MIMGLVRVGKTFTATAVGHAAVRRRFSVVFWRTDVLLKKLRATASATAMTRRCESS